MIGVLLAVALAGPADLPVERARVAMGEERADDARRHALEALRVDGSDWRAHLVYLWATTELGLAPRVDAEYASMSPTPAEARIAWTWDRAARDSLPRSMLATDRLHEADPKLAALALASVAAADGMLPVAQTALTDLWLPDAAQLRIQVLRDLGDDREAVAVARHAWTRWPDHPEIQASVFGGPPETRRVRRVRKQMARRATRQVHTTSDPVILYRSWPLFFAMKDSAAAHEVTQRLRALGEHEGLGRASWGEAMRRSMARVLTSQDPPELPVATPSELREIGARLVARLASRGRVDAVPDVWKQVRAHTDGSEVARLHAESLLQTSRLPEALRAADDAVRLACGPGLDDAARLRVGHHQAELAEALATRAGVRFAVGKKELARLDAATAGLLDTEARFGTLRDQLDAEVGAASGVDRYGGDPNGVADAIRELVEQRIASGDADGARRIAAEGLLLAADRPEPARSRNALRALRLAAAHDTAALAEAATSDPQRVLEHLTLAVRLAPTPSRLEALATALAEHQFDDAAWFAWAAARGAQAELPPGVAADALGLGDASEVQVRLAALWADRAPPAWVIEPASSAGSGSSARPAPAAPVVRPRPRAVVVAGESGPAVGEPAPTMNVTTESGPLTSAGVRGQVVIVNFWASWCAPCRQELPELARLERLLADEGVAARVVAVSVDESRSGYARTVRRREVASLTTAWSPPTGKAFGVTTLPVTYLIDATGVVRHIARGYSAESISDLERRVRALAP